MTDFDLLRDFAGRAVDPDVPEDVCGLLPAIAGRFAELMPGNAMAGHRWRQFWGQLGLALTSTPNPFTPGELITGVVKYLAEDVESPAEHRRRVRYRTPYWMRQARAGHPTGQEAEENQDGEDTGTVQP